MDYPRVRLDRLLKRAVRYYWRYEGDKEGFTNEASGKWLLDMFPCGVGRFVWSRHRRDWILLVTF